MKITKFFDWLFGIMLLSTVLNGCFFSIDNSFSGIFMVVAILIGGPYFIVRLVQNSIRMNKNQKASDSKNLEIKNRILSEFGSKKVFTNFNKEYISWNGNELMICNANASSKTTINRNEILSVAVLKDGETIFEKSTLGTAGRALVGGVLLGGLGAVIGATSGKTSGKEKVNRIQLEIRTRNEVSPRELFDFYNGENISELKRIGITVQDWAALLETVIENNKAAQN